MTTTPSSSRDSFGRVVTLHREVCQRTNNAEHEQQVSHQPCHADPQDWPEPPSFPSSASAKASNNQATTSSTAAQRIAVVPSEVVCSLRSSSMRASTGNAVMLIADAEKEHERHAADAVRRKADAQRVRQQRSHGKGKQDAHPAGQHRGAALLIELRVIQIHPDQEQIEDQAHRAQFSKRGEGVRGKDMRDAGEVAPEHGGPDQDAADNFAHHARLAKLAGKPAANQRHRSAQSTSAGAGASCDALSLSISKFQRQ